MYLIGGWYCFWQKCSIYCIFELLDLLKLILFSSVPFSSVYSKGSLRMLEVKNKYLIVFIFSGLYVSQCRRLRSHGDSLG